MVSTILTLGFLYCVISSLNPLHTIKGHVKWNRLLALACKTSLLCGAELILPLLQNFRGTPLKAKLNTVLGHSVFHFTVHYRDEWRHRKWICLRLTPKSPQLPYLQQHMVFHSDLDAHTHGRDGCIPALHFVSVVAAVVVKLPGVLTVKNFLISGVEDLCSRSLESHIWVPQVRRMKHCSGEDNLLWIAPDLTISFRKNCLMGRKRPGGTDRNLEDSHTERACGRHSKHYIQTADAVKVPLQAHHTSERMVIVSVQGIFHFETIFAA